MLERLQELLSVLAECQVRDENHFGCAPIELSIGGVSSANIVESGVVYLKECPRSVIDTLSSLNYHLTLTKQGLRVDVR